MEGVLARPLSIRGRLSNSHHILGALLGDNSISGKLTIPTYVDVDIYSGSYEVSPDFDGKTLPTANKTLIQDVTVKPIEVQVVSNTAGGKTVYIGGII